MKYQERAIRQASEVYLSHICKPHREAIKSLYKSAQEEIEGFIADSADEVANITVTVSGVGNALSVLIKAELNEVAGHSAFTIAESSFGEGIFSRLPDYTSTLGQEIALKTAKALYAHKPFYEYAEALLGQYVADFTPLMYYEGSIECLQRSLKD